MTSIKPGALVFVGEARPLDRAVIWQVVSVDHDHGTAVVRSGMTERRAVYALDRLTPFAPRLTEPARS